MTTSEKKIVRKRIDKNAFIEAWKNASKNNESQTDIAKKLGCTPGAVSGMASRLRGEGVSLPKLTTSRGPKKANADVLNDKINEFYSE
jgi:predicted transcriptional regulator